jgi:hypothetical protein
MGNYLFGPLVVDLVDSEFSREFLSDFSGIERTERDPDLVVTPVDHFREPPLGTGERVQVSADEVYIDHRFGESTNPVKRTVEGRVGKTGFQAVIREGEGTLELDVHYDGDLYENPRTPLRTLLKYRNRSCMYRREVTARDMFYDVFEPVVQLQLVDRNHSFVHASGVVTDEGAVLFTGDGGVGKTSTSAALVREDDLRLISDDVTIVSGDGTVRPYPKSCVVYPSDFRDRDVPEGLFGSALEKYHWKARRRTQGVKGVRRRSRLDELYGADRVNYETQPVSTVVFLSCGDTDTIEVTEMSVGTAAERSARTICDELTPFTTEYLSAIRESRPEWPSQACLHDRASAVFADCFGGAELKHVRVPDGTSPAALAEFVRQHVVSDRGHDRTPASPDIGLSRA